jgi:hypothetical protein
MGLRGAGETHINTGEKNGITLFDGPVIRPHNLNIKAPHIHYKSISNFYFLNLYL